MKRLIPFILLLFACSTESKKNEPENLISPKNDTLSLPDGENRSVKVVFTTSLEIPVSKRDSIADLAFNNLKGICKHPLTFEPMVMNIEKDDQGYFVAFVGANAQNSFGVKDKVSAEFYFNNKLEEYEIDYLSNEHYKKEK
jgi:hypothetical protein